MKLLKAFLISLLTSTAFAAGGTHVLQGDPVSFSNITATSSSTFLGAVGESSSVYLSTGGIQGADEYQNGAYQNISTITWSNGNSQTVKLTINTTFKFVAPSTPTVNNEAQFPLQLRINTGAGSFTTSWPGSVDWGTAGAPTTTTAANKDDWVVCRYVSIKSTFECVGSAQGF